MYPPAISTLPGAEQVLPKTLVRDGQNRKKEKRLVSTYTFMLIYFCLEYGYLYNVLCVVTFL